MANLPFVRNSEPITDSELYLLSVAIRPFLFGVDSPDKDIALLVAKMFLRIQELKSELADVRKLVEANSTEPAP